LFAEEGTLQERIEDVANDFEKDPIVVEIVDFLRASGTRSVCTPRDSKEG
jgi:UDP-N-acetylglucosamine acyltransferase